MTPFSMIRTIFPSTYSVNTEVEGKIVRIIEKGVIVELPLGVDGFVPASQLAPTPVRNIAEKFKVGDVLPLSVVEFDKDSKKIVLSVLEYLKGKEAKVVEEYTATHKIPATTVGDVATVTGEDQSEGDTSIPTEN